MRPPVPDDVHLEPNIPGNPADHFTIVPPGSPARAGCPPRADLDETLRTLPRN
jgi:hypothetical protein